MGSLSLPACHCAPLIEGNCWEEASAAQSHTEFPLFPSPRRADPEREGAANGADHISDWPRSLLDVLRHAWATHTHRKCIIVSNLNGHPVLEWQLRGWVKPDDRRTERENRTWKRETNCVCADSSVETCSHHPQLNAHTHTQVMK